MKVHLWFVFFNMSLRPWFFCPVYFSVVWSLVSLYPSSFSFVSPPFYPSNNYLCGNWLPLHSLYPRLVPLCVLCLSLVAYGRALTAPTPGLTLLMPPGVPDLCYVGTPTPAVIWSRCQIPPLYPPTSSLSKQQSWVIVCLHKPLSAFHVATPFYLQIALIWLHHSSSHQRITAHICCECLSEFLLALHSS